MEKIARHANVTLTERAKNSQRDNLKIFERLPAPRKHNYKTCGELLSSWLLSKKIDVAGLKSVEIDRLPDIAGVTGDVTDIRIKINGTEEINLSLKNVHPALKHPRLTRVPTWVGISPSSSEEKRYLGGYNLIWGNFIAGTKNDFPGAAAFNEVKERDAEYINNYLYLPLCSLVCEFLKKNATSPEQVAHMFRFFVGIRDFIKVINFEDRIEVRDFSQIKTPGKVTITQEPGKKNYIFFEFDNGWVISLRLHTASTLIMSKSIKFDVQSSNLDELISPIILNKSQLLRG